jgi:hypothetical protein
MTFSPNTYDALQWALDANVGNGEPYEDELVGGLAVLRALNSHDDLRASRGQRCYEFDGVAAHTTVSGFALVADWTIAVRCKTPTTELQYVCSNTSAIGLNGIFLQGGDFGYFDGTSTIFAQFVDLTDWSHVVVTKTGTTYRVYLNGDEIVSGTLLEVQATGFTAGIRIGDSGGAWDGHQSDARFYNVPLSSQQISDWAAGIEPPTTGRIVQWHMNEEAGDQSIDSSGQKNHGTILNATLLDLHTVDSGVLVNAANSDGHTIGRNALTWSEQWDNAIWNTRGTIVVTPDDVLAPDGSMTADRIDGISTAGNDIWQNFSVIGGPVDYEGFEPFQPSFYIKRITTTEILSVHNPATSNAGYWDLDLSQLSDDWERITVDHPAVTVIQPFHANNNSGGLMLVRIGAGSSISCHVWGAQIEVRPTVGTYQRTEASTLLDVIIPQDASDPANDALLGLPLDYTGLAPNSIATQTPVGTWDGVATRINNAAFTQATPSLTITAWIKRAANAQIEDYFSVGLILFRLEVDGLSWFSDTGATSVTVTTPDLSDAWHHIAVTQTGTTYAIYLDGVQIDTGTLAAVNTSTSQLFSIGSFAGGQFYAGQSFDFRYYDVAKTPAQIAAIASGAEESAGGLVRYPICEGKGDKINNVFANALHGVVAGANLASWWANQYDAARDHGIVYGGRNAATFDGGDRYVEGDDQFSIDSVVGFSVACQFTSQKFNGNNRALMLLSNPATGTWPRVGQQNTGPIELFDNVNASTFFGDVEAGIEFHVTVVYSDGFRSVYVDGVLIGAPDPITNIQQDVVLAVGKTSGNPGMIGPAYDARVYLKALTAAEALFLATGSGDDPGQGVITWLMDDNQGTLIRDTSGNGNDGTLIGDDGSNFWVFVPGLLDGSSAADGNPITLLPTHFCNNASEIVFDPWGAPELLGLGLPATSSVGELLRNVDPVDTKLRSETGIQFAGTGNFDGLNDVVTTLAPVQASSVSDPFTLECWTDAFLSNDQRALFGAVGGEQRWSFEVDDTTFTLDMGGFDVGENKALIATQLPAAGFRHVAVVWDGTTATFYNNGEMVGSMTLTDPLQWPGALLLGDRRDSSPVKPLESGMALARSYAKALTQDEVRESYLNRSTFDNLVTKYDFTNGDGLTLTDSSGNGFDGTLVNVVDPSLWWGDAYLDGQSFADGDDRVFTLPERPELNAQEIASGIAYIDRTASPGFVPAWLLPSTYIVESVQT